MPPDLNSLPPSTSSSPYQNRRVSLSMDSSNGSLAHSLSPRSSSISLQATATMNAAADSSRRSSSGAHRGSPQTRLSERRRSGAANLHEASHSDPTGTESPQNRHNRSSFGSVFRTHSPTSIAGSPVIATGDPHHQRAPSLGELHQELEQEQEAQVNRLLLMIRNQQAQLQQLQSQQQTAAGGGTAIDDSTPTSERSFSFPPIPPLPVASQRIPIPTGSNLSARRGSNAAMSPLTSIHPAGTQGETGTSAGSNDWLQLSDSNGRRGSRDENSYYQAETAALSRENQMLKVRIRELERQVAELTANNSQSSPSATQPSESTQPTPAASATTSAATTDAATESNPQTPTVQGSSGP
ncbi:hypothetical protein H112_05771 [Trichophyton rubrum D6]|uniref:Uncharacterized protein n=5 Tax=Trichophyton TaxID=5550 RepID=F2SKD1_TRIRC|nr:uncharacterized protein TERG_03484 [Trichophyton rubrum CBS 118892]EZF16328.1 hypothetical protein H100_05788 [Trichophyton rubrum MR850]EZF40199.1 hypothetical protein H102_05756 [Trichophyton rubrum CBS 100081]EZF50971.1 hypothetical protein H103_05783 [Trichophyton rubrum CBS 288.86]EZF61686.1 hypothetical protein H104_05767 [Trichophyton rubrum CBS 289.86]EZF72076.1 hypothetical protein H105_05797 [Trichophyton soudanense CBS 452.61]EZF82797.1 hypothetical protein H110_05776 [Trichophy